MHLLRTEFHENRAFDLCHSSLTVKSWILAKGNWVSIVENRKAFHDYFIEERYEAGLVLHGWEVKAIRAGRSQLKEAYVIVRNGEVYLIGAHISPLASASTHVSADPVRTRKLLLHAEEIRKLIGKVERAGYTLVPLNLHFTKGRIKLEIGLAKGKKQYDKREAEKKKDWQREQQRLLRARRN
jgi:SsrA-binding protein